MTDPDAGAPQPLTRRALTWVKAVMLGLSAILWLSASACFLFWFDSCAAITVFPPWIWLIPGLLLIGLGVSRRRKRLAVAVAALWLIYLLLFTEELRSVLRFRAWPAAEWEAARASGKAVRVMSLNCFVGSVRSVAELKPYEPDIVLLQESPGREDVERMARELFGDEAGVLAGPDTSIIVRGELVANDRPPALRDNLAHARVRLRSGIELELMNVRLIPALVSLDLWSPQFWREQTARRQRRWSQARLLAQHIESVPDSVPLIVGGDFNAPARDPIYRLLRPRLRDAFADGGVGWCDTMMNEFPVLRLDQIWASDQFRAAGLVARKSRGSDHRVVICDLILGDGAGQ